MLPVSEFSIKTPVPIIHVERIFNTYGRWGKKYSGMETAITLKKSRIFDWRKSEKRIKAKEKALDMGRLFGAVGF